MEAVEIRPVTPVDAERVERLAVERWGADLMVAHGRQYALSRLPGFLAEESGEMVGLVTYTVEGAGCEIVSLDSMREGRGIGGAMVLAVIEEAKRRGLRRLWLVTTNDNLRALRFYQKRGFLLVAVHRDAVAAARQIKPEIPLVGDDGIPIRDEIELEMLLTSES